MRLLWSLEWRSKNELDGDRRYLINEFCLPVLFLTRARAAAYARDQYGYIKTRHDLRAEPHGWRMPQPVRVTIAKATDRPMTAPPPDALVAAVARALFKGAVDSGGHCNGYLPYEQQPEATQRHYEGQATAAIAICRAHYAGLARAHGAAIRARISITDDDATAARFEQRALVAHEVAEIIEGKCDV